MSNNRRERMLQTRIDELEQGYHLYRGQVSQALAVIRQYAEDGDFDELINYIDELEAVDEQ